MSEREDDALRRRIAQAAARGVAGGSDATRAVFRAARRVAGGWVPEDQLPSHAEVCDEVTRGLDPAVAAARQHRRCRWCRLVQRPRGRPPPAHQLSSQLAV